MRQAGSSSHWIVVVGLLLLLAGCSDSFQSVSCDGPDALQGDFDGDGTPDRVVHELDRGRAVLSVCTSTGALHINGLGNAAYLSIGDVQDDGVDEIFYGSTDEGMTSAQIAVIEDGELQPAIFRDNVDRDIPFQGEPLVLLDGFSPDASGGSRRAWGCPPVNDGDPMLNTVAVTPSGSPWQHDSTDSSFHLEGATVVLAGSQDTFEYGNPLSMSVTDDPETGELVEIHLPEDQTEMLDYVADFKTSPC